MAGTFALKKDSKGKFMFNLLAENNKVVLTSELYEEKQGAMNGIDSVKENAKLDERFERLEAKNKQPYFVLKAANHKVIGTSEQYSSKSAMEDGIAVVKKLAPKAAVKDEA